MIPEMSLMNVRSRIRNASPSPKDASSIFRLSALAVTLLTSVTAPALAQDTARARIDSLAARVERAEEKVRLLEQQLAAESQAAVRTRSRMAMEFRGRVLVNAFSNSRRVNSTGNPGYVRPDDPADPAPGGVAMQIRQTSLGMAVTATHVLGASLLGDIDVDFGGGQLPSSGGRTFPLIRMRTARAVLQWPGAELLLGQDSPLIAGLNPVSLAALTTPEFAASGNLWLWLPQARVGVETSGPVRFGIQGAVLAPGTSAAVGAFEVPDFDVAEKSKRPFLESRVRMRWGSEDTAGEIGFGAHWGWYATATDSIVGSHILAADALVPVTRWLEVRAEAYDGRAARSLGGGGIGQLFGNNAVLIRSRGGWGQINIKPAPTLVFGAGYGVDDPHDADITASARLKNVAQSVHAEWRPAGPLVFGAEFRRVRTYYVPRSYANDHINLAFGFEF